MAKTNKEKQADFRRRQKEAIKLYEKCTGIKIKFIRGLIALREEHYKCLQD